MLFWMIVGIVALPALVGLAGGKGAISAKRRRAVPPPPALDAEDPLDLLARDAPAALGRYGTPEVARMLEEQGRGDELRGLGYRGGGD